MQEEYDQATARHYAAYRPPLHERILRPVLGRSRRFRRALDVGCGVGHSSVALARYGAEVVGVDPAPEMIRAARRLHGAGWDFRLSHRQPLAEVFGHERFDLFAFAGSLAYRNPEATLHDVGLIKSAGARVLIYDFEVNTDAVRHHLGYPAPPSDYRHDVELPERKAAGFERRLKISSQLGFAASPAELAHLLLSVRDFRRWAADRFGHAAAHARLAAELGDEDHRLTATTWCSLFAFRG